MLKKVISDESGRMLAWTLVVLSIGALLIPPFLSYIDTNILATHAIEEGLKEQYAADAGVEHAISRMSTGEYTLGEPFNTPTLVNNLPVSVTITTVAEDVYRIVSEAGDTRIESYVSTNYSNLSWLLGNAITSAGDVIIQPNSTVAGDVTYANEGTVDEAEAERIAPGFPIWDPSLVDRWPTTSDLSYSYLMDVKDLPSLCTSIDVYTGTQTAPYILGPLYCDGDLDITSSVKGAVAKLSGTIYVTGKLRIGASGKEFTLDLNGQTIYVEYDGIGDAIVIGTSCIISGSGCIIAEGDIFFLPKIGSGDEDFVLVMSVNGTSKINPQGSLYGAVIGNAWVELQPNNVLTWTNPYDKKLNFPNGTKGIMEFVTYRIY